MSEFLEYKPDLHYTYKEINTIDNTPGNSLLSGHLIVKNTGSEAMDTLGSAIDRAGQLKGRLEDELKDVLVPTGLGKLDDMAIIYLEGHPDKDRLVSDGLITYQMYKYARSTPGLDFIAYNWEMHQAGVDGSLEAELVQQLEYLTDEIILAADVVEKVVNYDTKYKNLEELYKKEMLEIEQFINMDRKIDQMYLDDSSTREDINNARKAYFEKRARLEIKKAISKASKKFARDSSNLMDSIEDSMDKKKRTSLADSERTVIDSYIEKAGLERAKAKLLIYQAHKSLRDRIVSTNQDMKTIRRNKQGAYKSMITNMRVYMDVAMPFLNGLEHTPVEDSLGIGEMLRGAESMAMEKQAALLGYVNETRASTQLIKKQIKGIIEKDKTRSIYKNF